MLSKNDLKNLFKIQCNAVFDYVWIHEPKVLKWNWRQFFETVDFYYTLTKLNWTNEKQVLSATVFWFCNMSQISNKVTISEKKM